MTSTPQIPNGAAEPSVELTSLPSVVGINFGNSYASIAVFTKEGLAECIANEDGEHQIACAISFYGEEMALRGPPVNDQPALVIQHPDLADTPAYKVTVLQPVPTPLRPGSTMPPNFNTPAASALPTP
ncbi:hypothetical protein NP233_g7091 [Leucocoprinus birnbaumii]|uniref:Uncharacterized protein n=1 Tax=Leucocoprinus birnbaumii TaxID=56174 RepID=A0AAD5YPF3_9AGAR|nr:hypothetical protein NP233_g7091 [Leucocoprinus birnbaumii]